MPVIQYMQTKRSQNKQSIKCNQNRQSAFKSMENEIVSVYSSGEFCSERQQNSFKHPKKCRNCIIKTLLGVKVADKIDHIFSNGFQRARTNLR